MTVSEIIESLGGATRVAYDISHPDYGIVSSHAIRQWVSRNRIPIRYQDAIRRLAKRKQVELPERFPKGLPAE